MTAAWFLTAQSSWIPSPSSRTTTSTQAVSCFSGYFDISSVSDCSRFWECGPAGETCLFECAPCQAEINTNPLCDGQWALTFDVRFQYPVGPVCDWPSTINCTLGCPEDAECCNNLDCNKCSSGYCNLDWTCSYDPPCE